MSISANGALEYFSTHVEGVVWQAYGEALQAMAIVHARRELSRMLGRELSDSESAYVEGDQLRDEYAVYEQALYLLRMSSMPNAESSAPVFATPDPDSKPSAGVVLRHGLGIAPGACRWLGVRTTYAVVRG